MSDGGPDQDVESQQASHSMPLGFNLVPGEDSGLGGFYFRLRATTPL